MSAHNLDSSAFNARSYFKNFIKDKSVDEVLSKNNELHASNYLFIAYYLLLI